jgi:hypothetical protein
MLRFNSDEFIKEMEEIYGIEELPLDYEDFENYIEEYEKQTERDLKNDL